MNRKDVSVARELSVLAASIDALRMLADHHSDPFHPAKEPPIRFAKAVQAALTLVGDRVQLLESVVSGCVNPGLFASRGSERDARPEHENLVIGETSEEVVIRCEKELRMARVRLDAEMRGPKVEQRLEIIVPEKFPPKESH